MKAVILAGGLGTRLRPFTQVIPKPLLPLGEQSLLEVQINSLKECGFDEIYIATNYRSEYIEAFLGNGSKYGVKLSFSREEEPLGTCGPLSLLRDELDEPFLMMNGDILTRMNFAKMLAFAEDRETPLTIGTKIVTMPFRFGNVSVNKEHQVTGVEEKPDLTFEILAGVYCFLPSIFDHIPSEKYYGMDDLIREMLVEQLPISRFLITDYWLDIGQVEDYTQACEEYHQNFEREESAEIPVRIPR